VLVVREEVLLPEEAVVEGVAVPRKMPESPPALARFEREVFERLLFQSLGFLLAAEEEEVVVERGPGEAERGPKRWGDAESHPPATEQETNHSSIVR
jgi:hypothetical protein